MLLEVVAPELGLEREKTQPGRWRGAQHLLDIDGNRFYDHRVRKSGTGVIRLIMHVRHCSYRKAIDWLTRSTQVSAIPEQRTDPVVVQPQTQPTFTPPVLDDKQWPDVRRYLIESRSLPEDLIDSVHHLGALYADSKGNAVFLRTDGQGQATGAELLGTEEQRPKLSLAPGTVPDVGWFRFMQGSGKLTRAVLTESPISTLSLAALEGEQHREKTLYISVDEAEGVPQSALQKFIERGGRVEVAFDADKPGDRKADHVINSLPGATRRRPTLGRNWNDQLRYTTSRQELAEALKQVEAVQLQPRFNPKQHILNAIKQDRATHKSACEQDLKAVVKGLVAGHDLQRIQKDINTTSNLVKHWEATEPNSIQALAKTIQYVQELCSQAETHPLYYQELYNTYASDISALEGHLLPREELDQLVARFALKSHSKEAVKSILKHSLVALVKGDEYVQQTLAIAIAQQQKRLPQQQQRPQTRCHDPLGNDIEY